jgi:hypothetical protein
MQKKKTVDELKKGGVKVIGREREIKDVDGNKVKAATVTNGASLFPRSYNSLSRDYNFLGTPSWELSSPSTMIS